MRRRTVLQAGAGITVAGLAAGWALPAEAAPTDLERILANVVTIFAGTQADQSDPTVASKVRTIGTTASARLKAMADPAALPLTATALFSGVTLGTAEASLTTTFQYLAEIGLATVTPGTPQFDDAAVQRRVVAGIDWVHRAWYGDQARGYYGNWYAWEIGIPTQLTKALAFVRPALAAYDPALLPRLVATMDAYLRAGKGGDVDLDSRFHTGANLADITGNRIIQGALVGDEVRVAKAVADQSTVFATIDPQHLVHGNTDGYYADGSFIQHDSVAYTGSYGKVLLSRVVLSVKLLDGTSYTARDLVPTVQRWITQGFAPVIVEGYMMEIVKGRGVSRPTTGYADVVGVIEAAVDLSRYLTGADATRMRAYAKHLATSGAVSVNAASFVSPATIVAYDALRADPALVAADLVDATAHITFNAMERDVHRRPGFTFAVARSSSRISKYEYMSGENLQPWFQGDGAYYLYLHGQDQSAAFGADYYATVGAYGLAGVTAPVERRLTVPEAYGRLWYENPTHPLGFTSSSVSQNTYVYFPVGTNDFSGGVRLGADGVSSMVLSDDVAWRDKQRGILPADFLAYANARGVKTTVMIGDQVVVLGAGITGGQGRAAMTTIDARTSPVADAVTLTGEGVGGLAPAATGRLPWARWANASTGASVGYVVLAGPAAEASVQVASVPRSAVRTASTGTAERRVASLRIQHPAGTTGSFAYALLPGATEDAVRRESATPSMRVLRNDTTVQAVEHPASGLSAYSFVGAGEAGRLVASTPVVAMVQQQGPTLRIAISDPLRTQEKLSVAVRGRAHAVGGDPATVTFSRRLTTVAVQGGDGIGRTRTVELRMGA